MLVQQVLQTEHLPAPTKEFLFVQYSLRSKVALIAQLTGTIVDKHTAAAPSRRLSSPLFYDHNCFVCYQTRMLKAKTQVFNHTDICSNLKNFHECFSTTLDRGSKIVEDVSLSHSTACLPQSHIGKAC